MAITHHGSASNPADNSTSVAATIAITPPASMLVGDLVIMIGFSRNTASTISLSSAAGQTWSELPVVAELAHVFQLYYCRFNGTWGGDPTMSISSASSGTSGYMHVFRPTSNSYYWTLGVDPVSASYSAPSSPFTVTITGVTAPVPDAIILASWYGSDDNTWDTIAGGSWADLGDAQYRNTSGAQYAFTFAQNLTSGGGSTGNVSKNQATNGGDAGRTYVTGFYEYIPPAYAGMPLSML